MNLCHKDKAGIERTHFTRRKKTWKLEKKTWKLDIILFLEFREEEFMMVALEEKKLENLTPYFFGIQRRRIYDGSTLSSLLNWRVQAVAESTRKGF